MGHFFLNKTYLQKNPLAYVATYGRNCEKVKNE